MRLRPLSVGVLVICLAPAVARSEEAESPASADARIGRVEHAMATGPMDSAASCEQASNVATTHPTDAHLAIPRDAMTSHASAVDGERSAEPPPKSLVAQQGLLVPAAFLAAATALSGLIVYAIRGRGVAQSSLESHAETTRQAEPAAH